MNEQEIIDRCKRGDVQAQRKLYERYAPIMFGLCKRYFKAPEDAEDVLVEAFIKIYEKLEMFRNEGSFEGWMKRIVVNESLMALRKRHNFHLTLELSQVELTVEQTVEEDLSEQDILQVLNKLPVGYRTVFNLYVVEGYKHKEIAEMLGISINTSKSQLILAKERLSRLLKEIRYPDAV